MCATHNSVIRELIRKLKMQLNSNGWNIFSSFTYRHYFILRNYTRKSIKWIVSLITATPSGQSVYFFNYRRYHQSGSCPNVSSILDFFHLRYYIFYNFNNSTPIRPIIDHSAAQCKDVPFIMASVFAEYSQLVSHLNEWTKTNQKYTPTPVYTRRSITTQTAPRW